MIIAILVLSCLKLSEVNSIPNPNTKSKEPISKKSYILHSTELVSIIPRSGIIIRDNGYSAFFEMFKLIMIFLFNFNSIIILTEKGMCNYQKNLVLGELYHLSF